MFRDPTVYILGAGASYPYGYPLGKTLIEQILTAIDYDEIYLPRENTPPHGPITDFTILKRQFTETSNPNFNFTHIYKKHWPDQINFKWWTATGFEGRAYQKFYLSQFSHLKTLAQKIKEFHPTSIDSFLRDHQELELAGKIMICYCLLKAENTKYFENNKDEDQDNWYRFLLNSITSSYNKRPSLILTNQLNIITFNYDLSLEFAINSRLPKMVTFVPYGEEYSKLLINKQINHIYGKLYPLEEINTYSDYRKNHPDAKNETALNLARLLRAYSIHQNINLIPARPDQDVNAINTLKNAKNIYIIGFGFDEENNYRIGLPTALERHPNSKPKTKNLYLLNYSGNMTNLKEEFEYLAACSPAYKSLRIFESKANKIENAITHDLKKMWELDDRIRPQTPIPEIESTN